MRSLRPSGALVLFVLFVFGPSSVNAQVAALRVEEPSPTAASLGKFGDVPVSLYTGTPGVNVPLHAVRGRTLGVPITLTYHASGVKVEDIPGWVGAGWSLGVGGVITRTVRGLPDDGVFGFMNTGDQLTEAVWVASSNQAVSTMLAGGVVDPDLLAYVQHVDLEMADPEPDQFFFNVGGLSGQFFFTNDGTIRLAPHQNIQVIPDPPTFMSPPSIASNFMGIPGWTILTEDGTKYRFGQRGAAGSETAREYTINTAGMCAQCASVSSWYLLDITSATGDETISFSYTTLSTAITHDRKSYHEKAVLLCLGGFADEGGATTSVTNIDAVDTIRLEEISSDFETVTLVSTERGSAYMTENEFKLDTLTVVDGAGDLIRSFALTYSPGAGNRLFLDSVQEFGYHNAPLPPYLFEYAGGALPDRLLTNDVDHWGYYNAVNNAEPLPELVYESSLVGAFFLGGADKEPTQNVSVMERGALKKIVYPTGGFTDFTYEPHEYGHVGIDEVNFMWIKDPSVSGAAPGEWESTASFSIGPSVGGNPVPVTVQIQWALDPSIPSDNHCKVRGNPHHNPDLCLYARILDDAGNEIYVFNELPDAGSVTQNYRTLDPDADYLLHVRSNSPNGGITATVSWQRKVPAVERPAGGLRIRQIRSDDGIGNTITKTYVYDKTDGSSSGVLVFEPRSFYSQQFNLASTTPGEPIPLANDEVIPPGTVCEQVHRSVRPVAGLGLTQGSPIGYEQVTVLNGADSTQGYTVHRFTTANFPEHEDEDLEDPLNEDHVWAFAARTSRDFKRGRTRTSNQHDGTGASVQRQINEYFDADVESNPPGDTFQAARAIAFKGTASAGGLGGEFYFKRYEVLSAWSHRLADSVQVEGTTTLTRTYAYDPGHLQRTRLTETSSDGRARITENEYAHVQYPGLAAGNMLVQPYRQTVKEGATVEARQWTTWDDAEDGGWRPREQWVWAGSGTPPDHPGGAETIRTTRFDDYDALGRVTLQLDARDRATTFTYGGPDDLFLTGVQRGALSVGYDYYEDDGRWGLLRRVLDENGHATSYAYDDLQRLSAVFTDDAEPFTTPLTRYDYHFSTAPGDLNYVQATSNLSALQEAVSKHFFDGLGRPVQIQLQENANSHIVSATEYDALGRVAKAWKPYRANTGLLYQDVVSVRADAEAAYDTPGCDSTPYVETIYEADPLNRVAQTVPPHCNGAATPILTAYGVLGDYAFVETTDEDANITRVYADGFGNQIRAEAGVGWPEGTVTEMGYDILGNLVEVRPPNHFFPPDEPPNQIVEPPEPSTDWDITYTYDTRSQLRSKTTPDTDAAFEYTYDVLGNLRFLNDPNHVIRAGSGFLYTRYDDFDRVVETGVYVGATSFASADPEDAGWPSSDVEEVVTYTYDSNTPGAPLGGLTINNPNGHLTQVSFDDGYYQYSYDDENRIEAMHVHLDSLGSKLIDYTYDRQGNVTNIHYQAGASDDLELVYTYDDAGRLKRVESQTGDEASLVQEAVYTYTPTGQVNALQLGADSVAIPPITYIYHIRDWLTRINDPANLGDHPFAMELGYELDLVQAGGPSAGYKNGNVSSVAWRTRDNVAPTAADTLLGYSFGYDVLNRLTAATTYSYQGSWQPMARFHVPTVQYDHNGNITALHRQDDAGVTNAISYSYQDPAGDLSNRLFTVAGTIPDFAYSFVYDPNGNMAQSRVATGIVHDRRNLPTSMDIGASALLFRYDADGQRIYKRLIQGSGATETFYLRGLDGSVLAVYTDSGTGARLQYWNILSGGALIGRIAPGD